MSPQPAFALGGGHSLLLVLERLMEDLNDAGELSPLALGQMIEIGSQGTRLRGDLRSLYKVMHGRPKPGRAKEGALY